MIMVKPPYLVRKIYSSLVWRFSSEGQKIYLTFDDGPVPEITPWVLDELKKHNAKATFFCVGQNVEKYPEIYKRIISEEHSVGNHTYDHLNGWKTKDAKYFESIKKCADALSAFSPSTWERDGVRLFRPPYGKLKKSQIKKIESRDKSQDPRANNLDSSILTLDAKFKIIMWDVLSYDFDKNTTPEECYTNVVKHTQAGSIVVFHDSDKAQDNLRYTLPKVFEYYTAKGYSFTSI